MNSNTNWFDQTPEEREYWFDYYDAQHKQALRQERQRKLNDLKKTQRQYQLEQLKINLAKDRKECPWLYYDWYPKPT